jgi:hypothetical protein
VKEPALSQTKEETIDGLHAGAVEAPAAFERFVLTNRKWKRRGQHDIEVPFARAITDVTGMSLPKRKNGDMHVGYSRRTALGGSNVTEWLKAGKTELS